MDLKYEFLDRCILKTIEDHELPEIHKMIDDGLIDVNEIFDKSNGIQQYIFYEGKNRKLLKMLYQHEKFNKSNFFLESEIQIQCFLGNLERVKELLMSTGKEFSQMNYEHDLIYISAFMCEYEILEFLIEQDKYNINSYCWIEFEYKNHIIKENYCKNAILDACFRNDKRLFDILFDDKMTSFNMKLTNTVFEILCLNKNVEFLKRIMSNSKMDLIKAIGDIISSKNKLTIIKFVVDNHEKICIEMDIFIFSLSLMSGEFINDLKFVKHLLQLDILDLNAGCRKSLPNRLYKSIVYSDEGDQNEKMEVLELLARDKRVIFFDFFPLKLNEFLWPIIAIAIAVKPTRLNTLYFDDYAIKNSKIFKLMSEDLEKGIKYARITYGIYHEMAADLWVKMRFIENGYLKFIEEYKIKKFEIHKMKRFLDINFKLPLEIQMAIANKCYFLKIDFIEKIHIDKALKITIKEFS